MRLPVAVLLVNYHVHDELDRALSSLTPFLRAGDEVVVVDQESDAARLDRIRVNHPRVTFVPTATNVGPTTPTSGATTKSRTWRSGNANGSRSRCRASQPASAVLNTV